ncbi:HAD-IIIA family hydrolase [Variovorax paradoxus]|uniref:HAD-IIIA family hydrolase n=1 Tax=Variovorax paradoxus TaxID=34073 RepID=UPI003D6478B6
MKALHNFDELRALNGNWLSLYALPTWTEKGYDHRLSLFHERLDFSGAPLRELPRRLMVQCRQLYVLAQLTCRGMHDGRTLIARTWDSVVKRFYHPALPNKWAFSVDANGEVADSRCDAYTLAFLLFALAWIHRVEPNPEYIRHADEVLRLLDGPLAAPGGGLVDAVPRPDGFLRQNPHMHLLEACLALHESTGRSNYLERALTLHGLFSSRMLWRAQKALPELHNDDWKPARPADSWYEPGHHFEWVWLLRRLSKAADIDVDAEVKLLLSRALVEGIDAEGFAIERVGIAESTITGSRRSWGTCEYLKACAVEAEAAPNEAAIWRERAALALTALHNGFLSAARPGLWHDRVDAAGNTLSNDVPASSLYHFVFAMMECERVFGCIVRQPSDLARKPALFLDRDGVINIDTGYPRKPADITFVEGVGEAIQWAKAYGYRVVVVSNQSAIARAYATEAEVMALHRWMADQLDIQGAPIDAWYHCPFHEKAQNPAYLHPDHYDRKPNAGMILRAAQDLNIDLAHSRMIGDNPSDLEAARRAGVSGHLFTGGNLALFTKKILAPT